MPLNLLKIVIVFSLILLGVKIVFILFYFYSWNRGPEQITKTLSLEFFKKQDQVFNNVFFEYSGLYNTKINNLTENGVLISSLYKKDSKITFYLLDQDKIILQKSFDGYLYCLTNNQNQEKTNTIYYGSIKIPNSLTNKKLKIKIKISRDLLNSFLNVPKTNWQLNIVKSRYL